MSNIIDWNKVFNTAAELKVWLAAPALTDAAGKKPLEAIEYILKYALLYLPEGERAAALKDILASDGFIIAAGKAPYAAIEYTLDDALKSLPEGERAAAVKDILASDWFTDAAGKQPWEAMEYILEYALPSLSAHERAGLWATPAMVLTTATENKSGENALVYYDINNTLRVQSGFYYQEKITDTINAWPDDETRLTGLFRMLNAMQEKQTLSETFNAKSGAAAQKQELQNALKHLQTAAAQNKITLSVA